MRLLQRIFVNFPRSVHKRSGNQRTSVDRRRRFRAFLLDARNASPYHCVVSGALLLAGCGAIRAKPQGASWGAGLCRPRLGDLYRFAIGSGNSIPDYVPVSHYLAMVDEALKL